MAWRVCKKELTMRRGRGGSAPRTELIVGSIPLQSGAFLGEVTTVVVGDATWLSRPISCSLLHYDYERDRYVLGDAMKLY